MKADGNSILAEMNATFEQSDRILRQLSDASERLSTKNSTVIIGAFGGFAGLTSAYLLSFFTAAAFLVLGPLLASLGLLGCILLNRGLRRLRLERFAEEHQIATRIVLTDIDLLKEKNAPPDVIEGQWRRFGRLCERFEDRTNRVFLGQLGHKEPLL